MSAPERIADSTASWAQWVTEYEYQYKKATMARIDSIVPLHAAATGQFTDDNCGCDTRQRLGRKERKDPRRRIIMEASLSRKSTAAAGGFAARTGNKSAEQFNLAKANGA